MRNGFAGWKDLHQGTNTITVGKKPVKAHKFHATKTELHGVMFDSKREAARYSELLLRGLAGEIADLELQPSFPIVVNGVKVATYKSDFGYFDLTVQRWIVEDVKSPVTRTLPTYRLKKKLVEALHGIQIVEV